MTVQKRPVTAITVGEAIFQYWRDGQNATVENVMKALGSTHRQKVNDLMAEGRVLAGEMIKTREAESQLEEDFPLEAFGAIRDWAKKVAEARLNEWEKTLKTREAALLEQKEHIQAEQQATRAQIVGMEIQLATLSQQLSEANAQAEQTQAALQAKCAGLETALIENRERAGQAEARLEVTAQALESSKTELQNQRNQLISLTEQRDDLNKQNQLLLTQNAQLNQQANDLKERRVEDEHRHQHREATWLTERDSWISKDAQATHTIKTLNDRIKTVSKDIQVLNKTNNTIEKNTAALTAEKNQLEQALASATAQLNDSVIAQAKKDERVIELERLNAALLAQLEKAQNKGVG